MITIEIKFEDDGRIVPYFGQREITMNESPFLIFLATAGMSSAIYIKAFCRQLDISLNQIKVIQQMEYNAKANLVTSIDMQLELGKKFPEKYEAAIKNVVAQCPIKKHMDLPPKFNVLTDKDLVRSC